MPYKDRLMHLNLPTLTYRRLRGDMIEVFKPPQPFYGPFSGTTRCQKRTSGLYGVREGQQRQTHQPSGWAPLHPD